MVEIISKRSGPRREDVEIRRIIEQNRPTIARIADHISNGAYSAGKVARPARKPKGLIIHTGARRRPVADVALMVRISLNGRVVAMDGNTGRQLHHLGEIRARAGAECFALATKANGFFSPVDESIAAKLTNIDGTRLGDGYGEDQLVADIGRLLSSS